MLQGQNYLVRLQAQPIDEAELRVFVSDAAAGGNTVFTGSVRNHHNGRAVVGLRYEAYLAMAQTMLTAIAQQALMTQQLLRVAIIHRYGDLLVGDLAIAVAASAVHRGQTFAAVAAMMDRIKQDVPIWKYEYYADGCAEWVHCRHGQIVATGAL